MIAKAGDRPILEGVAPQAELHSAGFIPGFNPDDAFALAANTIAKRNGMRAINVSATRRLQPPPFEKPDGNTHPSQFIDWSADKHDVLYVVARDDNTVFGVNTPVDNFNGMAIAASQPFSGGSSGIYRQAAALNEFVGGDYGDRKPIDLLAPGFDIRVGGTNETESLVSGTSFAAPHVTAAVAPLQQYAENRLDGTNYRQPEVMKAILLNSADKLAGVLSSQRDVVDKNGLNWMMSEAFTNPTISLDDQMGAGHLNAASALLNLSPGEQERGTVERVGWDYDSIGGPGATVTYDFDEALATDDWVSLTLVWNRDVVKIGSSSNYSSGDTFFKYTNIDQVLNNLDLYLMPKGSTDFNNPTAVSRTTVDNVEHIFFQIETPGEYQITVRHAGGMSEPDEFALAWRAGETISLRSDFDEDGNVDDEDLGFWEQGFGLGNSGDANGDGDSDGGDFLIWQREFGNGVPSAANSLGVPEPAAWLQFTLGLFCLSCGSSRRSRSTEGTHRYPG